MVKVKDITAIIEEFAPLALQQSYDNSGLVVGRYDNPVSGVLLAVDVTVEVLQEAIDMGANMVITHHPIIFNPVKRFNSSNYVEVAVEMAIKNDINLYACHTNLDSVEGGTSWYLADKLGVKGLSVMQPSNRGDIANSGFGVVGEFERDYSFDEVMNNISQSVGVEAIKHSRVVDKPIRRVALCTGSGGSLMGEAIEAEVDLYITSDLRYNDFMTPDNRFTVIDIGHFESEYCAIDILYDVLSKKMLIFAPRKSLSSSNPVHYWVKG
ncbi:MAG: Nif3-like dinuclear metal center hexameric protein [Rikenellaceae bacterium]